MSKQFPVYLSLGSNLEDRFLNLQTAIQSLHENIGTIIKVSPVYETPAWGFQSELFLNCAVLIHTHLKPVVLLRKILKLEQQMGRERFQNSGYEARKIDIDILAYDQEIVSLPNLQIPHNQMANRRFVLQPLVDIAPFWEHPQLKKSAKELLVITEDASTCIFYRNLDNPMHYQQIKNCNYIAIEGNIGAGKTTLTTKIAEDFNAKLVLERFADNPFLPKFYKDQNRYAFPLEMSFLADRYQQLTDDLSQFDLFKDFVVSDYFIFKSLIFAKVTLAEDEFRLYKTMFDIIHKEMPKPDLYVYLYQNTDRLLANIKKRGRSYEQEIPAEYLEKINRGYLDYIKTQSDLNVLVIDISEMDFLKNQKDYTFLLETINAHLAN
uniref:2-amino-4-hydroxy-6- hydroxymethyldihydropteridine diphosphokinase n=1 Tax=Flavobacterium sp. TaxID=239 RepID=UPI00404988B9